MCHFKWGGGPIYDWQGLNLYLVNLTKTEIMISQNEFFTISHPIIIYRVYIYEDLRRWTAKGFIFSNDFLKLNLWSSIVIFTKHVFEKIIHRKKGVEDDGKFKQLQR